MARVNCVVGCFTAGPRTKALFPDLGHVFVPALVSDAGLTENLTLLVKEAILRNVRMLDHTKGAGYAELAYLEPSAVSEYRLAKTFAASMVSYRLLMFLKLFNSVARPAAKSLPQLREDIFNTYSAPSPGTSSTMAQHIRDIRSINSLPDFFAAMGITKIPTMAEFTTLLRSTITDSVLAGYSCMSMTQSQLFRTRKVKESDVESSDSVYVTLEFEKWLENGERVYGKGYTGRPSIYPEQRGALGGGGYGRGPSARFRGGYGGYGGYGVGSGCGGGYGNGRGGHGGRGRGYGGPWARGGES
ncbi:hypothetical protein BCR34DRAFT_555955 [Clohesyomyces aquaticus]|uniref:Uncharacterized protein n=1 Tax=Clohesyomyces aquaticus TaxID=1231657 RepID=A0A1Y2A4V7_9PLEO|nr:hypothetical protein BCR34DRAFT_555955 [Clohesyomyces aquaticus]